ncbi:hypothetical protein EGR_08575 [Echinococcus granulosus]|uniref:Uncharacterized protein n=1 Tax=Echinococcus granulosus TaxID=6210 RepID=W6UT39_ECHGR|nr:hypothetical protein EGR_08575 [Echinococcus granulosus]EUB56549.1 hypothetical protein EGR_08575 [Echinococcus granulosus]
MSGYAVKTFWKMDSGAIHFRGARPFKGIEFHLVRETEISDFPD